MKKLLLLLIACSLAAVLGAQARVPGGKVTGPVLVVARYHDLLVSSYVAGAQGTVWSATDAQEWITTLDSEGRWPDIDYANRAGGAWPTAAHLRRVRVLARELADPKSKWFNDAKTADVALRALAHWTTTRYQNPNWWQNQIGVPQVMRDIIVLLGDRLNGDARAAAMAVLHQANIAPEFNGANLVWSAELVLMAAALENNEAEIARASALIAKEIAVGGEQGIQDDYSFHQHGARLQQFHYGASFFQDTVRIAWLLRGTEWAVPEEKVRILADLADLGNFWMSRGTVTVPGTLDRAVSRPGAMKGADMRTELELLAEVFPERRSELRQQARVQAQGYAPTRTGFRAFPHSDFATYHQSTFSVFLKTISTRTEVTETLSRENRRGGKLNWGDHYLLKAKSDYVDLPPVWDWELLPGVTSAADMDTIQRREFVGAVGDIYGGASVMDYAVGKGEATTLTARKFWVTYQSEFIGLIGALNRTDSGQPVRTALDQRRLRGAVTVADEDGVTTLTPGKYTRRNVRWIQHDGLLYVPLSGETISFSLGPVTGSWNDINLNHSTDPITEPIFLAVLEHGEAPKNVATGFIITPCASISAAKKQAQKPTWKILRNDATLQAVRFSKGAWLAALYAPGEFSDGKRKVHADAPCLLYFNGGELRASDPTQKGLTVNVRIGTRSYALSCPAGGKTSAPVSL
ncbi:polysaccharide lyase family 8 super-sandwich domain-containing protein [Oleiharenicola lentus]|uniref:polysaccharide lyase family 8 super-sandwich domain-containing protein n=1 Tax=Oleiharenicola lentus TaxID=2508720 RepID=UPI003F675815